MAPIATVEMKNSIAFNEYFLHLDRYLIDEERHDKQAIRNHLSTIFWVTSAYEYFLLSLIFHVRTFAVLENDPIDAGWMKETRGENAKANLKQGGQMLKLEKQQNNTEKQ